MFRRIVHSFSRFALLCCLLVIGVVAYAQQSASPPDHDETEIKAPATEGTSVRTTKAKTSPTQAETTTKRRDPTPDGPPFVRYTGELMRDSKSAISGVFPITFELYEREKDTTPLWQEQHFVAVDLGTYTIDLGKQNTLPKDVLNQRRWLAVNVQNLGELLREQITLKPYKSEQPQPPTKIQNLSFAELADRAVTADLAHMAADAQRLGGKTLEEIDRFGELQRQFVQLRARVNNIQSMGNTTVAERTTMTDPVGNGPGEHFRLRCPAGQVVVGITGRANDAIRNAQLICAPLEPMR